MISSSKNNIIKSISKLQYNFNNNLDINVMFCDIQDKYINKVYCHKDITNTAQDIADASKILKLNQIVTEHKKEVFGETIQEIKKHFNDKTKIYTKTRFPMLNEEMIDKEDKDAVYVLLGMETHICITQTAVELLKKDKNLFIIADGVTSANKGDRSIALKNLQNMGAIITTSQSFLFLLMQNSDNPYFKSILHILKAFSTRENILLNESQF